MTSDVLNLPGCKPAAKTDQWWTQPGFPFSTQEYKSNWWSPQLLYKGPMRKYAGTAFFSKGWPTINNCNAANGFYPVINRSDLGSNDNCDWREYVGYCQMNGEDYNRYIDEKKNQGTTDRTLIDFSKLDKIRQDLNPASFNFVGDVLITRGAMSDIYGC